MSPKVAVLMIGTNNAASETPNEITAGIRAICNTLRALLPETKLLLLGVFPRGTTPDNWLRGSTPTNAATRSGPTPWSRLWHGCSATNRSGE